jgi:exopolysaccharide biosynthesis polyprenyl glycosylphosphotransferase
MKRSELVFNIVSIPVDIVSLILAGLVSFYIRLRLDPFIPIAFNLNLESYLIIIAKAVPALLVIFAFTGLYNLRGTRRFSKELYSIIVAISIALLALILIFFFDQQVFPSRLIMLTAWLLGIIFVVIGRFILKRVQVWYLTQGYGLHKLVVIRNSGEGEDAKVINYVRQHKDLGYEVIAELQDSDDIMQKLEDLYHENKFEEILQANFHLSPEMNAKLAQFSRNKGLVYNFVPNIFDVQKKNVESHDIEGIPVISLKNTPLDGWGQVYKRIFDIIVSIVCLLLTSPFFILFFFWIKLDSKGKVLYAAPRAGRGGPFTFYKFRSMYSHLSVGEEYGGEEAEKVRQELWKVNSRGGADGAFLKIKEDPRVTKVGRFLRRSKLDELPQFINVLRGDMSMVGPRAHVLDEVDRYKDRYPRMFTVKPGIFGLSQIAQLSWPDLPFEEEIRLNTYYIENWSIWMDIVILTKTFYYLFLAPKKKEDNDY